MMKAKSRSECSTGIYLFTYICSIADKKVDAVALTTQTLKRYADTINNKVDGLSRPRSNADERITFPIPDDAAFAALEENAKESSVQNALRAHFEKNSNKCPYDLFRQCINHLFSNTTRYTWSGRSAYNSVHKLTARAACSFEIFEILLGRFFMDFKGDYLIKTIHLVPKIYEFFFLQSIFYSPLIVHYYRFPTHS